MGLIFRAIMVRESFGFLRNADHIRSDKGTPMPSHIWKHLEERQELELEERGTIQQGKAKLSM